MGRMQTGMEEAQKMEHKQIARCPMCAGEGVLTMADGLEGVPVKAWAAITCRGCGLRLYRSADTAEQALRAVMEAWNRREKTEESA